MNWKEFFQEGFLPAPMETEEQFCARVALVKKVLKAPDQIQKLPISVENASLLLPSLLSFTSNRKLPFWYAGMTWIVQPRKSIRFPVLQIRKTLWGKKLSIDEVISHEKVHALRVMYDEKKFEEILAFQTARSKLRKWISPIFSCPRELAILSGCLLLSCFASMSIFYAFPAIAFLLILSIRLVWRQKIFKRAYKEAENYHKSPLQFLQVLTDHEIHQLSRGKLVKDQSFRWEFIEKALSPNFPNEFVVVD